MTEIDNDTLFILKALYEERRIDAYELHVKTKIPPTTLFCVLERERLRGNVVRDNLLYSLTNKGEESLKMELGQSLIRPSMSFKSLPDSFSGKKVSSSDISILDEI